MGGVIIMEPVIEIFNAREFTAWPVGPRAGGFLGLSGELAPADVGTAMAVIAAYNYDRMKHVTPRRKDKDHRPAAIRLIEGITQADGLIAPGGLRVRDTVTGAAVNPGCCCGLEDWQDWKNVAAGESPWFGHDPEPWVEHLGTVIRAWPDGGDEEAPSTTGTPIDIPADDLPRLIAGTRERLQGFLALLEPWALPLVGATAASLAPILATHFNVTWPAPDVTARP